MRLRRLPLESSAPVLWFAAIRLLVTLSAVVAAGVLRFPYEGELFAVLCGLALPWAVLLLLVARWRPALALHPVVTVGDFAVLVAVEAVVPEMYGAVRFLALFLVAAHAHFQGDQRGLLLTAGGVGAIVLAGLGSRDPVSGDLGHLYEALFAISALATAAVVGGLRTAESTGRLRARELTRRTFATEDELRRRLAESIHDGPVQELVSLEMMLSAARAAERRGDLAESAGLLEEAQGLAARNVRALRDEIVGLGPDALQELSFEEAVSRCRSVWERRFGLALEVDCAPLALDSELNGTLFRITQEAVANAGRHAGASTIRIELRHAPTGVELRIADDGRGFGDVDPLGPNEPGHLGLAGMRERAEAAGAVLGISTGDGGTTVVVSAPIGAPGASGSR